MDELFFNSSFVVCRSLRVSALSAPALGCAIHFVPVTSDAASTLTARDLPPFAPWLAPLGPDSLCEGPKWLEPKLTEEFMKEQNNTIVKLSQDKQTLIVSKGGVPAFISVNLIKHLLDIPYTKKDGTVVSLEDIRTMKSRAREAYAQAVVKNANATATAGA